MKDTYKIFQNKMVRGFMVIPPLVLSVGCALIMYVYFITNIEMKQSNSIVYIFIVSVVWLLVSTSITFWSDLKSINKEED